MGSRINYNQDKGDKYKFIHRQKLIEIFTIQGADSQRTYGAVTY